MITEYGKWPSPITGQMVAGSQKAFGHVAVEGDAIYWEESRPSEGGRVVVVSWKDGVVKDEIPAGFSSRSRVHEYGGGSFGVRGNQVYFVNDKDQRIYSGDQPVSPAGTRFADLIVLNDCIVAVGEEGKKNFLARIEGGDFTKIAHGHDFYASPVISPDGQKIAFLTWDRPHMPWEETELWVANWPDMSDLKKVAGGESIYQPGWTPQEELTYVSDKTGWWNIYLGKKNLTPHSFEYGLPQWIFGSSTYGFSKFGLVATYRHLGQSYLVTPQKTFGPYSFVNQLKVGHDFAVFVVATPGELLKLVRLDLKTGEIKTISENQKPIIDAGFFSKPEFITFKSGIRDSYAFYYPPQNDHCEAPKNTLPPLLVMLHGGPTSHTNNSLRLATQYWTSRGFAVIDIDYAGSTGYGRAYRDLLKGQWGIADVEDCVAAVKHLIAQKKADPKKIAIRGGSAGGYTTLCALTFTSAFTMGASYYGVGDLIRLHEETHTFESGYDAFLIGPYPEMKDLYIARSPIYHTDKLNSPVIFFQGAEDLVVPKAQSEAMYEALKAKGIRTELVIYEGEQHGFRRPEHIIDSLQKELEFYTS
jgi:dipeptidyl aminopeptidase/acylaminoacyl peptidase